MASTGSLRKTLLKSKLSSASSKKAKPMPAISKDAQLSKKKRQQQLAKLKKKKSNRPDLNASESESSDDDDEEQEKDSDAVDAYSKQGKSVMDIFRKNFEAQFGQVEGLTEAKSDDDQDNNDSDENISSDTGSDSDEKNEIENNEDFDLEMDQDYEHYNESDDSGADVSLSSGHEEEDSDSDKPVVVKFLDSTSTTSFIPDKRQKKLFMSSHAPKQEPIEAPAKRDPKEESEEQLNLDNDLALQRLIKESHILAEAGLSGVDISTGITGRARHKTLDLRLDELGLAGAKTGQMPMKMRKGMVAKQAQRKERHIREAKEAGIVLARETKKELPLGKRDKSKWRERGLKINSVGRETRNGLFISKSEISKYTGTSSGSSGGKRKGGKRR
jgi:hypothetical protein